MIQLTEKAKQDFEKWLSNNYPELFNDFTVGYILFDTLNNTCNNALIIEWFDSVGIYICIEPKRIIDSWIFDVLINEGVDSVWSNRQEATTKAIEKANTIYNNL